MRWISITAATSALAAIAALAGAGAAAGQVRVPPAHAPVVTGAPAHDAARAAPAKLVFVLPAAWVGEQPGSSMRLAQARIPGPSGAGEFAIFYFGAGGGGTAEANIERWIEQIDQPAAPPQRGSFSAHGLEVSWVDVAGTMKASTVGMGPVAAKPGSRLLGAVVEGPGGPWFVKAIGPDATVAAARGAFLDLLHGLRAGAP
ncbi:MAG TPA: hypothetical protein VE075_06890 [Thermoanaerobaculia bacterium]|nr:hypothetical protein [Thermoanaerobaculia bacterium]